jgi:16S rRNA (adenine1518-N6/adenine1519-N6)-dimethyltransferase
VTVRPKRALGQHFLVDENLLRVIGRLADLHENDVILEVGPGLGVLTRYLADRVQTVHAIELDWELEGSLRALALDLSVLDPPPRKLVSNLPYNVATPLVVESLDGIPTLERWCVMVQRELADRFFALPRTKAYGAVSVLLQLQARRVGLRAVPRTVFQPRPNVDSALVAFVRTPGLAPAHVRPLVEAAFAHRRKTLANSFEMSGLGTREEAEEALAAIGAGRSVRAEELSPSQFVALAEALG